MAHTKGKLLTEPVEDTKIALCSVKKKKDCTVLTEEELEDAQYHRESLVILYLDDTKAGLDIENGADRCVNFDKLVCEALGIDVESHPPDYIFDALVSGCGV